MYVRVSLDNTRQTLAKNHLILADKNELQQERYQSLLDDLKTEQTTWITLDNIDSKIAKELFDKEASTSGLLTRYSDHWRIYVESSNYDLKKLKALCAEDYDKFDAMNVNQTDEKTLEDRFSKDNRKSKLSSRLWVEDFVEGMITTGEERAQFQDIMKAYMKEMRHYDLVMRFLLKSIVIYSILYKLCYDVCCMSTLLSWATIILRWHYHSMTIAV